MFTTIKYMSLLTACLIIVLAFYIMSKIVDDYFIVSLDNISKRLKLSPSVAGATLMAMGTSAPELSTALFALFLPSTTPATGVGTIVGSAIFQILVVIGFAALVKTSYLNWKPVIRDSVFYALSIVLLIVFIRDGIFSLTEASFFVGTYFLYLLVLFFWTKYVDETGEPDPIELLEEGLEVKSKSTLGRIFCVVTKPVDLVLRLLPDPGKKEKWTIPIFVFSLAAIAYLSYWLVLAAESFALTIGIPPAIVALTILAGGTSIPELISSAVVAKQGRGDMAISNAIGSNIFDILISLGLPVFIYTLTKGSLTDIGDSNITSSIFLLFATLIAVILLLVSQKFKAGRKFGLVLLVAYVGYVFAAYAGLL